MIYLDGSCFFFDIEGCFSKLTAAAREESAEKPADPAAARLCGGFAGYYKTAAENVRAARDYSTLLAAIIPPESRVVIPSFDISAEHFSAAFPGKEALLFEKPADMKLSPVRLAAFANENGADVIFLSSPCCPTSLEMEEKEAAALAEATKATVIIDESHLVEDEKSAVKLISRFKNLVVIKKLRFGGEPVLAAGTGLPAFDCKISMPDQAAATVIFEHSSALKTAQRKLEESRDSLYIRVKKLAVKFPSVKRLYRSKADCVFFKVDNAKEKAGLLKEKGITVACENDCFCVFAGDKDENEAVLSALNEIL